MGAALAEETLLIAFILYTRHKHQALGLLDLITLRQTNAICEIVYNVLKDSFSNTANIKRSLKSHVNILRLLSAKKISLNSRRKGILSNKAVVYKLLCMVKPELLAILANYERVGSSRQIEADTS